MPQVILTTTLGAITLELDPEKAPETVENFLNLVRSKHYDETIFHRVIPGFMVQGGGFTAHLSQKKTGKEIRNEATNGLLNVRYSVAMARTSNPHSASAQFFINVADNAFLNHTAPTPSGWGYAVFGNVVEGFEVVDRIASVKTGVTGGLSDIPLDPIIILSAKAS